MSGKRSMIRRIGVLHATLLDERAHAGTVPYALSLRVLDSSTRGYAIARVNVTAYFHE